MSVNLSPSKGTAKRPIARGLLVPAWGLEGDSHCGPGPRQLSLLAWEAVERQMAEMRAKGVACPKKFSLAREGDDPTALCPGAYAENITTRGVDLSTLRPGDTLTIGQSALIEVTRIGKECHRHCAVYERLGECVMPREGVFARILSGGPVGEGDEVRIAARSAADTE
jgi:MOSC domain-containing protein YiiM